MADEVVGRGIIEVVGDATQFSASMAKVAQDAGIVEKKLVDTAQAIGETFKQAEQSTTVATTKIDGSTKRYIRSVEREIATLELSRGAYRAWEAQVGNIPSNVYTPYIAKLNEAIAAQNASAEAAKREAAAQREAADAKRTRDSFAQSVTTRANNLGKSQADIDEARAAQLGLTKDLAPYIAKLREAEGAVKMGGKALDQYGRTVGEVRNSLRQVPAQLTDIVVGLQSGQAPLTVLLQQGGQLKDMFGGVVPAAKALGGAILAQVSVFTVAGAAAAALAFGYFKGSQEADKFRQSIVFTGNATGTTTAQLAGYARSISTVAGTQAQAAETLAAFVSTGRVARENLEQFSRTAIELQRATGKAVADTVKEYAELGKEPVEASRKLNEQYGYLTLSVYSQIKALQDQGRATDAATLAQNSYDAAVRNQTSQIVENLGFIEKAWKRISLETARAGNLLLGVGRQDDATQQLVRAQTALANVEQRVADIRSGKTFAFQGGKDAAEKELETARRRVDDLIRTEADIKRGAVAQGEFTKAQKAGQVAADQIDEGVKRHLTNRQKLTKALAEYEQQLEKIRRADPNDKRLDPKAIADYRANLAEDFKDPKGRTKREKAFTDDAGTRMIQQIREANAALELELSTSKKLVGAQKELAEFNKLIADLKEKKILTVSQKELIASQAGVRAELERKVGLQQRVQIQDEERKAAKEALEEQLKLEQRIAQIQASTQEANANRTEQFDSRLSVFGKGSEAREQLASQTAIRREFQRYEDQLRKNTSPNLYDSEKYREGQANIKRDLDKALADNAEYYSNLKVLQSDWINGAEAALQDYVSNSADVASQTNKLFTDSFKGIEDAIVTFVRTGKLSFKSLVDEILRELLRIEVRKQLASAANSSDGFLGLLGNIATIFGGGTGFSTNSTGTSLPTSGGRAAGGPVGSGRIYEVAENGPEMLNVQGRNYLMMGDSAGSVTPFGAQQRSSKSSEPRITVINNSGTPLAVMRTQRLSDDEYALIVDDARRSAVAEVIGQMQDPNSRVSRTQERNYKLQRNR